MKTPIIAFAMLLSINSAQAAIPAACNITRADFEAQMVMAKHPQIGVLEPKLVYPFIAFFNKIPPVSRYRGDAIVTYEGSSPDNLRAAFFWRGCFVDDVIFVKQAFISMLMEVIKKRTDI